VKRLARRRERVYGINRGLSEDELSPELKRKIEHELDIMCRDCDEGGC